MLHFFRKNKVEQSTELVFKSYTDKELFQLLKEDEIEVTEEELQKARENDAETVCKIGAAYDHWITEFKAYAWYMKAAVQDYAPAQARIGMMYHYQLGPFRDYNVALSWLMKAASAGNATGQYEMGELYFFGSGVPKDYQQVMYWCTKASDNGSADAMAKIGDLYRHGYGVTRNIHTAIEWYIKAGTYGHQIARYILGHLYAADDEVKDLQKAANWYQKADQSQHPGAKNRLKELNEKGYYPQEEQTDDENV